MPNFRNATSIFLLLMLSILMDHRLEGVIHQLTTIEEVKPEVTPGTLVLLNVAEVLTDSQISLGTQAWRKFVRTRVDPHLHDELTLYVFQKVPSKAVEPMTASLIRSWQSQGVPVLAFTSRGRHEWYQTQVPHIDLITEKALNSIGIDFSRTELPYKLAYLEDCLSCYYYHGIIYATNNREKGDVLAFILKETRYRPDKVVAIDDKRESLETIEAALKPFDIPFVGYVYSRTADDHRDFDPMIANIQLNRLILTGQILTDLEAQRIKEQGYLNTDPNQYFFQVTQQWKDFINCIR